MGGLVRVKPLGGVACPGRSTDLVRGLRRGLPHHATTIATTQPPSQQPNYHHHHHLPQPRPALKVARGGMRTPRATYRPPPRGTARASRSAGQHDRRCSGLGVGERLLRSKPVRKRSHGQSSRGGSGRKRGASPTASHPTAHDMHHIKDIQSHCRVSFLCAVFID